MLCVSRVRHRAKLFCTHKCSVKCCTSERSTRNYNNSLSIYFSLSLSSAPGQPLDRHTPSSPQRCQTNVARLKQATAKAAAFEQAGEKEGGKNPLYKRRRRLYTGCAGIGSQKARRLRATVNNVHSDSTADAQSLYRGGRRRGLEKYVHIRGEVDMEG